MNWRVFASGVMLGCALILGVKHCVQTHQQTFTFVPVAPLERLSADTLVSYEYFNEAAVYAAARAYRCSHVYECGGAIGKRPDGRYVISKVDTSYSGHELEAEDIPNTPKGAEQVAGFHAHPCLPATHYTSFFSPSDVNAAMREAMAEIVLDQCTGVVHLFDPKTMPPETDQLEKGVYSTAGIVIGRIAVDGKSYDPDVGL